MIIRLSITLFLILTSTFIMSAQTDVKQDFQYKNLSKYLNEAIQLLEIGDFKMGPKKLTYAKKAMDKLIAKGFETDLQNELAQIKACEAKIANPESSAGLPKSDAPLDIRSTTYGLTKQIKTIQQIFDYDPAYVTEELSTAQLNFVKDFNRSIFLEKCATVQALPEINEPKYKRQLKEIKLATEYVSDLTSNATSAGVFTRIEGMVERMKSYKVNSEKFQNSTTNYLNALIQLMPNNAQLKTQYSQISATGNAITTEKQVAAKAAAAQKAAADKKIADERAANQAAVEKAANGIPDANLRDAVLESEFKRLGQAAIGSSFKIHKIIITASGWGVNKDAIGRPIARSMITYAIGKAADGNCYKQAMTFTQNTNGGSYGRTFYDSGWAYPKKEISCNLF